MHEPPPALPAKRLRHCYIMYPMLRKTTRARVARLGLLLLSAILACALLNSVAAIRPEAGVPLGSASVATVSTPTTTTTQLDRQAERQHRAKEQRSTSIPQAQRRVKDPHHGEGDARMRVLGVLALVVILPVIVVVETMRSI